MTTWSEHYPNERAPMKVCPLCHREFEPRREQQKAHCSSACAATAKRQARALVSAHLHGERLEH